MDLDPVTVELDLVYHLPPDGTLSTDVANSGSMNPGYGALTPIAAGFLRWNATQELHIVPDSAGEVLVGSGC